MDEKDLEIIRHLQADGRLTNHELAEKVNLSPSPCHRRVRRLEAAGIIRGYTANVNAEAYGLPVIAFLRVKLLHHDRSNVEAFEAAVDQLDAVQDCYMMTGECDYLLKIVMESLAAYETFVRKHIHNMPGVASIDTSFAYGKVKEKRVFPKLTKG